MNRRHVLLLLRRELLDMRRERRVLASLFLQPLLFIAVFAVPAYVFQQLDARARGETLTVAVQGDADAVPGLRAALERPPFRLRHVEDAARTLAGEKAEMGIQVPSDAAALVARGQPVPLQVLSFSTQDVSTRAIPALTRRLTELRQAESARLLAAAGGPEALAEPVRLEIVDVGRTTSEGVRFGIAQGIPALVVLQLFGVLSLASTRLSGAKDRRTLEAMLVLPCSRPDLLAGIGSAALLISTAAALVVLLPVTLLLLTLVASVSRTLGAPVDVMVSIAVGTAAIALLLVATGLYVGARSGSSNEGAVISAILQFAIFGALMTSPFLSEVAAEGPVLLAPLVGAMLFVRDGVADGPALSDVAVVLGSQLAIALVVLRRAASLLDSHRGVLRVTK
jgi:ABC-type Na+ efflux pump permease subunit